MRCPSCQEYDVVETVEVACLGEDGEPMSFLVCKNCDFGINEHTEGVCDCEQDRRGNAYADDPYIGGS